MGQINYKVEFYITKSGDCPAQDFLNSLTKDEQARVIHYLKMLQEHGRQLHRPHADHLRDHIWELRIRCSYTHYRMLYFFHDGKKFIITHGFKKQTSNVPELEIDKAIECREDYLNRVKDQK